MNPRYCILDYRIRRSREVLIDAASPALLIGDSLFETLPVVETVPVFLEQHLQRLTYSARWLDYTSELRGERMRTAIDNLMTGNLMEQGRLRITLFRRQSVPETEESLLITVEKLPERPPCSAGLVRVNNRDRDPLARHKTGNRLLQQQLLAGGGGMEEIVLVDERESLLEGTTSNLFLVLDGRACTPPREKGLLPGIIRGRLIQDERFPCEIRDLGFDMVSRASEAFITSSVAGVRALKRLGGREFGEAPGPLTRQAMAALEDQVLQDIAPYLP